MLSGLGENTTTLGEFLGARMVYYPDRGIDTGSELGD